MVCFAFSLFSRLYTLANQKLDELLNRIWYAGAYTNQMCTIDPNFGDALVYGANVPGSISDLNVTWYSNETITNGSSALVDGAKRDRIVWAGGKSDILYCKLECMINETRVDMAIAVPGVVVSTNDVVSIENSLNSLFDIQDPNSGQLPYSGRPISSTLSFTYHLYTLIGVANHYLYTVNSPHPTYHQKSQLISNNNRETSNTYNPSGQNGSWASTSPSPPSTPPVS